MYRAIGTTCCVLAQLSLDTVWGGCAPPARAVGARTASAARPASCCLVLSYVCRAAAFAFYSLLCFFSLVSLLLHLLAAVCAQRTRWPQRAPRLLLWLGPSRHAPRSTAPPAAHPLTAPRTVGSSQCPAPLAVRTRTTAIPLRLTTTALPHCFPYGYSFASLCACAVAVIVIVVRK